MQHPGARSDTLTAMVGRRRFFQTLSAAAGAALVSPLPALASPLPVPRLPEELSGHRVEGAVRYLGALVFRMRDPEGRPYQIDLLARGQTRGVRDTASYSFFLANRGDGRTATDEDRGQALFALAAWIEAERPVLPELLTFEERAAAHPNGTFLLP